MLDGLFVMPSIVVAKWWVAKIKQYELSRVCLVSVLEWELGVFSGHPGCVHIVPPVALAIVSVE